MESGISEHHVDLSAFPHIRLYRAYAGTTFETIGTDARLDAAKNQFVTDTMARLRLGWISAEEFKQYVVTRRADEASKVADTPTTHKCQGRRLILSVRR
jgi:hypothetical protein